ncbi:Hypothetical predicted protein [Paramuricea clavata]|uniref:Uncharacterized protein n=1 Tax=Paramuricea clavata TaxID=317549 RepID=A0A7D9IZU9_PARCT|nr:Hypothetical predicted protein [Paramuricea clavata]
MARRLFVFCGVDFYFLKTTEDFKLSCCQDLLVNAPEDWVQQHLVGVEQPGLCYFTLLIGNLLCSMCRLLTRNLIMKYQHNLMKTVTRLKDFGREVQQYEDRDSAI